MQTNESVQTLLGPIVSKTFSFRLAKKRSTQISSSKCPERYSTVIYGICVQRLIHPVACELRCKQRALRLKIVNNWFRTRFFALAITAERKRTIKKNPLSLSRRNQMQSGRNRVIPVEISIKFLYLHRLALSSVACNEHVFPCPKYSNLKLCKV